jgi:tRNA-2-methylthio-N6-dimethylallyladenosine synthase
MVTTVVTRAAPHYLIADSEPAAVRRTRGGDAWAARSESTSRKSTSGESAGRGGGQRDGAGGNSGGGVLLGMPAVGRPA